MSPSFLAYRFKIDFGFTEATIEEALPLFLLCSLNHTHDIFSNYATSSNMDLKGRCTMKLQEENDKSLKDRAVNIQNY